jgi:phosphoribosyl 1,2-cyclic phosphodiesterase
MCYCTTRSTRLTSIRRGWDGGTRVEQAVAFARISGVRQLVMFHHDPNHDDERLEILRNQVRELWGANGEPPLLAHEGMVLEVP